jgi:tRNA(Ile)-lysidine synthase
MNLLRGSGISGLAAMPPCADPLIRPLIECWRWETRAYCEAAGLTPCEDPSNRDPRFLRNRLRLTVLPLLEGIEPQVKTHLLHLAEMAAEEERCWRRWLEMKWREVGAEEGKGFISFDRRWFVEQPVAVQRRLLRWMIERVRGTLEEVSWSHIEAMREVAAQTEGSAAVTLPGCYLFRREQETLYLGSSTAPEADWPEETLPCPGEAEAGEYRFTVRTFPCPEDWTSRLPREAYRVWLDAECLEGSLRVRRWRPGDRFRPLGAPGSQLLQDYFTNRKVPRSQRQALPLVVDDVGILWVVGHTIAHRARIRPDTRRVVEIRAEKVATE